MANIRSGGGSFYNLLNKDIKELNTVILSLFIIIFLFSVGFISYKINNSYALFSDSIEGTKTINLEIKFPFLTETIIENSGKSGETEKLSQPATTQIQATTEYRYRGINVNNYIIFNNELWRIIGVFTVEDENGNLAQMTKIIKDDLIEETYVYDESSNNWENSSLSTYLNNDYYSKINNNYKSLIAKVKYYLASSTNTYTTTNEIYKLERGTTTATGNPKNIYQKIGIMYASDYGYAAPSNCDTTNLFNYDTSCYQNDWLFKNIENSDSRVEWVINHYTGSSNAAWEIVLITSGTYSVKGKVTESAGVYNKNHIRPTLYLKNTTKIKNGTGTKQNPYELITN